MNLEQLIEKAVSLNTSQLIVEDRIEHVLVTYRHEEGVMRELLPISIHNALERLTNTGIVVNEKEHRHVVSGERVSIIKIDDQKWCLWLCTERDIPTLKELELDDIHLNAIRLMESYPHGVRFVCSAQRDVNKRMIFSLIQDICHKYPNSIVANVTMGGDRCGQIEMDNLMHFEAGDCSTFSMLADIQPDIVFITDYNIIDRKDFLLKVVELSLTGVQVWCAMDAPSVLSMLYRVSLSDIPLEVLDIQVIGGIAALASVPKLCPHCSKDYCNEVENENEYMTSDLDKYRAIQRFRKAFGTDIWQIKIHNAEGCQYCNYDGYDGDLLLAEILVPDPVFFQNIREGNSIATVKHLDEQDFISMLSFAKKKIVEGLLDPRDAERIVGPLVMDEILSDSKIYMEKELENV